MNTPEFSLSEFPSFPPKKRIFLERYALTGSVTAASRYAGVSRRTPVNWRKTDTRFAAAYEEALEAACESCEQEARRRAVDGTEEPVYQGGKQVGAIRRYSDVLLIFLLKAMKPEKYRDGYDHGGSRTPYADREETLKDIERKLARLAPQEGASQRTPEASQ